MTDKNEEVKKILESYGSLVMYCDYPNDEESCAKDICQLFESRPLSEQELREKIADIDFCWSTCGEIAATCKKQLDCVAFEDRHNKSYGHPTLDYRKSNQIFSLIKEAGYKSPEEVEELQAELTEKFATKCEERLVGYVKLSDDQSLPPTPLPIDANAVDEIPKFRDGYKWSQADMLKEGWRKVEVG